MCSSDLFLYRLYPFNTSPYTLLTVPPFDNSTAYLFRIIPCHNGLDTSHLDYSPYFLSQTPILVPSPSAAANRNGGLVKFDSARHASRYASFIGYYYILVFHFVSAPVPIRFHDSQTLLFSSKSIVSITDMYCPRHHSHRHRHNTAPIVGSSGSIALSLSSREWTYQRSPHSNSTQHRG